MASGGERGRGVWIVVDGLVALGEHLTERWASRKGRSPPSLADWGSMALGVVAVARIDGAGGHARTGRGLLRATAGRDAPDAACRRTPLCAAASSGRVKGRRTALWRIWTEFPMAFLKAYILRRHILRGRFGFVASINYAFYRFMRIAKAMEARDRNGGS